MARPAEPLHSHYADRMSVQHLSADELLGRYRLTLPLRTSSSVDELVTSEGLRDSSQSALAQRIEMVGQAGLLARRAQARRLVDEDGITYGTGGDGMQGRNWVIDPLPVVIGPSEWAIVESGVQQRAELLDLVLADLYGPRTLIRHGVIPAKMLTAHPGFIRQVDGLMLPGPRQLIQVATDLSRDSNGFWTVFGDRAEAPSGAGYAMATRRIVTRVMAGLHRETDLARLRGFFHLMSDALMASAPTSDETPRVVMLSPGSESETAYDQAFLATLLGFPMVESDDLDMRDGEIWRRTTGRDERIDVLLRRVDASWCDPLDLRGDSRLGVPGLVEAVRRGTVSVANPLGSGVLENPGLAGLMPAVARHFMDADLELPIVDSYWCGDASQRSFVEANLDELIVKPLANTQRTTSIFTDSLTADELHLLRRRIAAEPWAWCAQRPIEPSSAPVITSRGLEPRPVVLRTFAVGGRDQYHVMPGGLARVGRSATHRTVSNATGALAKDVWVLSTSEAHPEPLPSERISSPMRVIPGLSPRSAEDLYWLGRHAERAEGSARLIRVVDDLFEDHSSRPKTAGHSALLAMLASLSGVLGVQPVLPPNSSTVEAKSLLPRLTSLVFDENSPGSVAFSATRLIANAQAVRELLSLDTWLVLSRFQGSFATDGQEAQLQSVLAQAQESLLALAGIMGQNMIRDSAWAFVEAGTRLERAQHTVRLLRSTALTKRPPNIDAQVFEAVLSAGESIITHRRRTASGEGPANPVASAVYLLLLDRSNPRSVVYQLESLTQVLRSLLGDQKHASIAERMASRLSASDFDAMGQLDRADLAAELDQLLDELLELSGSLGRQHFPRRVRVVRQPVEWEGLDEEEVNLGERR